MAMPRMSRRDYVFLTHQQLRDLAAEAGPWRVFVLLLGYTGLRWREATALRVCDIDLARQLAAAVAGKGADDLAFIMPGGSMLWLSNWRRAVYLPACGRARLSARFRIHDLRPRP
jgi:integrase